jgi:putative transposase
MMMLPAVNSLIEWHHLPDDIREGDETEAGPRIDRVLFFDSTSEQVVLFDISDEKAFPRCESFESVRDALAIQTARVLENDPFDGLRTPDSDIPPNHIHHRDAIWNTYVKPLVLDELGQFNLAITDRRYRGIQIKSIVEKTRCSKRMVYVYLRRYLRAGHMNGLLPDWIHCGGPGKAKVAGDKKRGRPSHRQRTTGESDGVNVTDEIRRVFSRGIVMFYETKKRHSLRHAYELTIRKYFNKGYRLEHGVQVPIIPPATEIPSLEQFRYWYNKEWDPMRAIIARHGQRRFEMYNRPLLKGTSHLYFGPGSEYQIDATIADVYLVSRLDRSRIIGRPVLYFVVDGFSRMVAGFSVGLDGPNWTGATQALAHAMTPKTESCAALGIPIEAHDWPCDCVPNSILADRGEIEGFNADNLSSALGITVKNSPPYRADWKGIVERYFRTVNDRVIHGLPGGFDHERERGESDHRLDACLTLDEFRQILAWIVLEYNRTSLKSDYPLSEAMICDGVDPIPIELWNWGVGHMTGTLRTLPQNVIRLNLLPRGHASVTREGIRYGHLRYTCPQAESERWFTRARTTGSWPVSISFDPRRVDIIYLNPQGTAESEPCTLIPKDERFRDLNWHEVKLYFETKATREKAHLPKTLMCAAFTDGKIAEVVQVAEAKKMQSVEENGESKTFRLSGIRSNRREEQKLENPNPSQSDGGKTACRLAEVTTLADSGEVQDNTYIAQPQSVDRLREVRQELWPSQFTEDETGKCCDE